MTTCTNELSISVSAGAGCGKNFMASHVKMGITE